MKLRSPTLDLPQLAIVVVSLALCVTPASDALAQTPTGTAQPDSKAATPGPAKLSLEQELSLSLLRTVADELKSEADKPAVALLQAEAADTLWQFDESAARSLFRIAFDTARAEPLESAIDKEARTKQVDQARRRAFTLRQIIVIAGQHDRQTAERWLTSLNEDRSGRETAANQNSQQNAEFLAYLAVQLVKTNPDEAQRLGFLSLNAREVPSAFGQLLFALKRVDPKKSDDLFKAAIAAMRRDVSPGGATLSVLSNYLFFNDGSPFSNSDAPIAGLFVDYLLESANAQARLTRDAREVKTAMPESAVRLNNFLALRGLDIVNRNAPQKFVLLQSLFKELSSALSQQQIDDLAMMTTGLRRQEAMELRGEGGLDADIQRAERERDVVVRDQLWRRLAVGMMHGDPDRARSLADRIDDKPLREQTQDDVNLVVAGDALRGAGYEEARKAALKFNDTNLRAKTLAEVADVWIRSKHPERAGEILSEAYEMAAKGEPSADRAAITLLLAQKFAKFDSERSFSLLEAAIKIINQVQIAGIPPPSLLTRGPRSGVITMTMVGGAELTTGLHATLDSLNFSRMAGLVRTDYFRSRNLGDNLQNKILRGRYLITLAQSFLNPNLTVKDSFPSPFPQ
ncbi:MAG TPA: hypothetical protein VN476_07625 [Pyrinomonadaceae bacterium]|nr:hypothetical protein [Pyrinomonadaceae bacterium]